MSTSFNLLANYKLKTLSEMRRLKHSLIAILSYLDFKLTSRNSEAQLGAKQLASVEGSDA